MMKALEGDYAKEGRELEVAELDVKNGLWTDSGELVLSKEFREMEETWGETGLEGREGHPL